jgi:predicted dehydrogenase
MEGATLLAVCDSDAAKAAEAARSAAWGCRAETDFRKILDEVDAVCVVTPTSSHRDIALACIKAGKHVFVEKPIASDVAQADEMVEAARACGLVLQIGHVERYNAGFRKLVSLVDGPIHIDTHRVSPVIERALNVDVIIDLMIHDLDAVNALVRSPVKFIGAGGVSAVSGKIDAATAWLEFESGVTAHLFAGRMSDEKKRVIKVSQRGCMLRLDYQSGMLEKYVASGMATSCAKIPVEACDPLTEELKDFIGCIKNGDRPAVTGEDGRQALWLANEITQRISRLKEFKGVMI